MYFGFWEYYFSTPSCKQPSEISYDSLAWVLLQYVLYIRQKWKFHEWEPRIFIELVALLKYLQESRNSKKKYYENFYIVVASNMVSQFHPQYVRTMCSNIHFVLYNYIASNVNPRMYFYCIFWYNVVLRYTNETCNTIKNFPTNPTNTKTLPGKCISVYVDTVHSIIYSIQWIFYLHRCVILGGLSIQYNSLARSRSHCDSYCK